MISVELLKQRIGYVTCGASFLSALVGALAPSNVEHAKAAFYLSALRHAIPECVVLALASLVLLLPRPLTSYLRSGATRWRSAVRLQSPRKRRAAAVAPLVIVLLGAGASVIEGRHYVRARYAYWVKDGLQRDFQVEQLKQAFQYEAGYEYERAIRKYVDIDDMFPGSQYRSLLQERIELARGLLAYSRRMYELGREEELHSGSSRASLNLYLESLRVNPRHPESQQRLARFKGEIQHKLADVDRALQDCAATQPSPAPDPVKREILKFAVDLPEQSTSRSSVPLAELCGFASRFPSRASFLDAVQRSWQVDRLNALLEYSRQVLAGKTITELLGKDLSDEDAIRLSALPADIFVAPATPASSGGKRQDDTQPGSLSAALPSLPPTLGR